jgi:hypothetical protein
MSNQLSTIFSSIEESTPGIEWAAFYLSGGGDDFGGFRELIVCINGEADRRGGAKENDMDTPTGTDLENIVNAPENQSAIIEAIVSEGQALKCIDSGACGGILLVVTKKRASSETITIPLDWRYYSSGDTKWTFTVPANFRGMMTQYENVDDSSYAPAL